MNWGLEPKMFAPLFVFLAILGLGGAVGLVASRLVGGVGFACPPSIYWLYFIGVWPQGSPWLAW